MNQSGGLCSQASRERALFMTLGNRPMTGALLRIGRYQAAAIWNMVFLHVVRNGVSIWSPTLYLAGALALLKTCDTTLFPS